VRRVGGGIRPTKANKKPVNGNGKKHEQKA